MLSVCLVVFTNAFASQRPFYILLTSQNVLMIIQYLMPISTLNERSVHFSHTFHTVIRIFLRDFSSVSLANISFDCRMLYYICVILFWFLLNFGSTFQASTEVGRIGRREKPRMTRAREARRESDSAKYLCMKIWKRGVGAMWRE